MKLRAGKFRHPVGDRELMVNRQLNPDQVTRLVAAFEAAGIDWADVTACTWDGDSVVTDVVIVDLGLAR